MPSSNQRGFLVSFEGIEGSGKSTQVQAVAAALGSTAGVKVTTTREPGGTGISEVIRDIVRKPYLQARLRRWFLNGRVDSTPMVPETELFLFEAARAQLVREVLVPALEQGHIVLLDRYVDSSIAYQGYGRGVDLAGIEAANHLATGGRLPDLTYLLDIEVEEGLRRKYGTEIGVDYMGSQTVEFYEKVRNGYLDIALRTSRIRVVEAVQDPIAITESIVTDLLNMRALMRPLETTQRQFRFA